MKRGLRVAVVAVVALLVIGASLAVAASETSDRSVWITKAQYGKRWPFTVPAGRLACSEPGAVTFTARGRAYAVNGTARMFRRGADIRPIWRNDPDYPGLKVNIGPIIDRGLRLC